MRRRERREPGWAAAPLAAAMAGALLLLGGCSGPSLDVSAVSLNADADANGHAPVAVDLVLVRDDKLLAELQKIPAADWFKRKQQYLRDHPDGLTVFDWEIVPDQHYSQVLPDHPSAWAGIVYANYTTPGDHRLLTRDKEVRLQFLDNDFLGMPKK